MGGEHLKRVRLLASAAMGLVLMLGLFAAPALADGTYHGKNCQIFYSGSGEKSFEACESVVQGDGGPVWGRFEIWGGPTNVDPYRVWTDVPVALKSSNATQLCSHGEYPSCNGQGDANGVNAFSLPSLYANAITRDTDHYSASEHLCVNRAIEWTSIEVIWSQNQSAFVVNVPDSDTYNSYPNCTSN